MSACENVTACATMETNATANASASAAPQGAVRDPLYVVIPVTALYAAIFVAGLLGNVGTCVVIARNRHLHTATNYYLFSLAVSDLLLLLSGLPQEVYAIWSRYPYVFGEVFCVLQSYAAETSANATVLTITAFTMERYVAICHPFRAHAMSRLSRAVRIVLGIWLLALGLAVPQASQFGVRDLPGTSDAALNRTALTVCSVKRVLIPHAFEISTFVFFVAPMTLITVLYVLIGLRLRRSRVLSDTKRASVSSAAAAASTAAAAPAAPDARPSACANQAYVIRMLVAVVVAFFICWAPHHAQRLLAEFARQHLASLSPVVEPLFQALTYVSGILYFLSTAVNPVLYHIMSHKFREAFKSTLAEHCGFRRGRISKRRTYNVLAQPLTGAGAGAAFRRTPSAPRAAAPAARRSLSAGAAAAPAAPAAAAAARLLPGRRFHSEPAAPPPAASVNCFRPRGASECSQVTASSSLGPCSEGAGHAPSGAPAPPPASPASSSSATISNSSLQDMDRGEFEGAELVLYMAELNGRR